ncbi:hypothetical protein N7539_006062 [Penicillium diatomitis]|uniref:Uncharacterized protein n=1 Tax=Penicillium diatomitis TaxID=2819901 RepID=A0A9X0BTQ8_9EURO|nr:uncharacterized protein N7539_006062 [Penicillium diatomitis]KAJ5483862.1 hypothetical protein N7539_006062 [Penicillium diatomitis]
MQIFSGDLCKSDFGRDYGRGSEDYKATLLRLSTTGYHRIQTRMTSVIVHRRTLYEYYYEALLTLSAYS